jgi:hypothetical protein
MVTRALGVVSLVLVAAISPWALAVLKVTVVPEMEALAKVPSASVQFGADEALPKMTSW